MLSESREPLSSPWKEFLHPEDRGLCEQVVQYYKLDDFKSHVWIAHQRYPTKGRVWHPAGAHPSLASTKLWSTTETSQTTTRSSNT